MVLAAVHVANIIDITYSHGAIDFRAQTACTTSPGNRSTTSPVMTNEIHVGHEYPLPADLGLWGRSGGNMPETGSESGLSPDCDA